MSVKVTELARGDRVVLYCEGAATKRRQAVFGGIFTSLDEAMKSSQLTMMLATSMTAAFLGQGNPWAKFIFNQSAGREFAGAFKVQPDGTLVDETGRAIVVEEKLGRAGHG